VSLAWTNLTTHYTISYCKCGVAFAIQNDNTNCPLLCLNKERTWLSDDDLSLLRTPQELEATMGHDPAPWVWSRLPEVDIIWAGADGWQTESPGTETGDSPPSGTTGRPRQIRHQSYGGFGYLAIHEAQFNYASISHIHARNVLYL